MRNVVIESARLYRLIDGCGARVFVIRTLSYIESSVGSHDL